MSSNSAAPTTTPPILTISTTNATNPTQLHLDKLNLLDAKSNLIHQELKKATEYGLTQSIEKWLLVEENEKLLLSKFVCLRWSQTKGFIVLKKLSKDKTKNNTLLVSQNSTHMLTNDDDDDDNDDDKNDYSDSFILYVDLLGALKSVIKDNNPNDISQWLNKTFDTSTGNNNNSNDNDDQKQTQNPKTHKIITLKQLYDIFTSNWNEKNIKVADHKSVNGVIEFRILPNKKKMSSYYKSLDDLYYLLESDDDMVQATMSMNEWLATDPDCLKLTSEIGIDINLTLDPNDDTLVSGHLFLIYEEDDGSLFLTVQYDVNKANQLKFAKEILNKFNLDDDNTIISETILISELIGEINVRLKDNNLNIQVDDEYKIHQEILFVVQDQ